MADTTWERAKRVFQEALETDRSRRRRFVEAACGGDAELHAQVEALLSAHDEAGGFLDSPTVSGSEEAARAVTALVTEGPAARAGDRIGPYKLLQRIGEGGFGVVYMAEQDRPVRRRVALKIIKLGMDTKEVIARFEAERQALAMMEHPSIAKVLDAGATEAGRPYFVMELVKGVPITEYCDANRVGVRERLELFVRVCGAVHHAHQKGIIHRDIKPSNVLVRLHGGEPVPVVIDFGIAKATNQRLTERTVFTRYGQLIGSPAYMSPEQAEKSGLDVDTRSDIYSLGVLFYELLTGSTPFDAGTLRQVTYTELLRMLREEEPARPSTRLGTLGDSLTGIANDRCAGPQQLARLIRGDLDWIVMKALEKDRTRRYDSASQFAADVGRYLRDEPITARPPSVPYRLRKFVKKNRAAVVVATVVAATILLGGSGAVWQGLRAQRQAQRARASAVLTSAAAAADPLLKALLVQEIADVPDLPGKLAVLRDVANQPLPESVLRGDDRLNNLTYSPDGRDLAASFVDGTVRIWRADGAGEPIVLPHDDEVHGIDFSPDGTRIATGSSDGTVRVWPIEASGGPVFLPGRDHAASGLAFSPDGERLVSRTGHGTIRIWPADGSGEPTVIEVDGVSLGAVEFSPDGERILSGGSDGAARIWRADGTGPLVVLRGHDRPVWAEFSHDGERVVTGSDDGAVRVWRADGAGEPLVLPHRGRVYWGVNFSGDDRRLVTASTDGTARIWSLDRPDQPIILRHPAGVDDAKLSLDGTRVLTAAGDGKVRVWRADGGGNPVVLAGPPGQVGIRRSPDGSRVVAHFSDGTLRTWRLDATAEAIVLPHGSAVRAAAFAPDGRLVTGDDAGVVRLWRRRRARERASGGRGAGERGAAGGRGGHDPIELAGHPDRVWSAAFSPDGGRVATASVDGTVRIRPSDGSGEPIILQHPAPVHAAAFSPDGARVVSGARDGGVRVWDAGGGSEPVIVQRHPEAVGSVAFGPGGRRVIGATVGGTTHVTNADGSGETVVLRGYEAMYSVAFSPDGSRVVTGSEAGDVRVWPADGSSRPLFLQGHHANIRSVAFSPDGTRVAAAATDGVVRLWRLDAPEAPLVLRGHEDVVWSVAFGPDGSRVATASSDGSVRIWRVTWPELFEYVQAHVRACLTTEQRRRFLGESSSEATAATAACERRQSWPRRPLGETVMAGGSSQ